MSLQIKNNNGIIEIKGNLIGKNATALQEHFELIFSKNELVTLSMDYVKTIDFEGINMLKSLKKKARKWNTAFHLIGNKNQQIIQNLGKEIYL